MQTVIMQIIIWEGHHTIHVSLSLIRSDDQSESDLEDFKD